MRPLGGLLGGDFVLDCSSERRDMDCQFFVHAGSCHRGVVPREYSLYRRGVSCILKT